MSAHLHAVLYSSFYLARGRALRRHDTAERRKRCFVWAHRPRPPRKGEWGCKLCHGIKIRIACRSNIPKVRRFRIKLKKKWKYTEYIFQDLVLTKKDQCHFNWLMGVWEKTKEQVVTIWPSYPLAPAHIQYCLCYEWPPWPTWLISLLVLSGNI